MPRSQTQQATLATFGCLAALVLLANNGMERATYVQYRPDASTIWNAASDVVSSASSTLGLGESSSSYAEDATKSALEAFKALSSSGAFKGSSVLTAAAAHATAPSTVTPSLPRASATAECLITKWSAVWVVHADRTRSHVGFPSADCTTRASEVEDIATYKKSHSGEGAYFIDEAQSKDVCVRLSACTSDGSGASASGTSGASGGGGGGGNSMPLSHPMVPMLGWGAGVTSGGAWMARTALRFNAPAQQAFPKLQLPPAEPLLLVFGGASVTEMLKNWVMHVKRINGGAGLPYVVACMDEKLFGLAEARGYPAVLMDDTDSGGRVNTRWKYYRMDPKAFLAMGILKVVGLLTSTLPCQCWLLGSSRSLPDEYLVFPFGPSTLRRSVSSWSSCVRVSTSCALTSM